MMAYPLALQLRNAYAFGTMGTITGIAAIAAFIAAAVMLVLGGLGLMHARRTSPDTDMFTSRTARTPEPGSALVPATSTRATVSPTLHPSARPTCQGVPGHPSKHGANIDMYWSRPLCRGCRRRGRDRPWGIVGKGIDVRRGL